VIRLPLRSEFDVMASANKFQPRAASVMSQYRFYAHELDTTLLSSEPRLSTGKPNSLKLECTRFLRKLLWLSYTCNLMRDEI
jgi:hypothetical protein